MVAGEIDLGAQLDLAGDGQLGALVDLAGHGELGCKVGAGLPVGIGARS